MKVSTLREPDEGTAAHVTFRRAVSADLPSIVRLLADDALGAKREQYATPLPDAHYSAFHAIDRDPNNELIVVESEGGAVVGVLQLTFIPGVTFRGGPDAIRFYERLGFVPSHEGMKRQLPPSVECRDA